MERKGRTTLRSGNSPSAPQPSLSPATLRYGHRIASAFFGSAQMLTQAQTLGGSCTGPCTQVPHVHPHLCPRQGLWVPPCPRPTPHGCEGGPLGEHTALTPLPLLCPCPICPGLFFEDTRQPHCLYPAFHPDCCWEWWRGAKVTFSGA